MDLITQLKQMPVWTREASWCEKAPYDYQTNNLMSDRSHLLTFNQVPAPSRQTTKNLMFLNPTNQTHLLTLDLENNADCIWKNLVMALPCIYYEHSIHGGVHALLPITDVQLQRYPRLFNSGMIRLGEHKDLELFPNGTHFTNLTQKAFNHYTILSPENAQNLVDNFLKLANEKADHFQGESIKINNTTLPQELINFGNHCAHVFNMKNAISKYDKMTGGRYGTGTAKSLSSDNDHYREFMLTLTVQKRLDQELVKTNLHPTAEQYIYLSYVLSQMFMTQAGWQRPRWNEKRGGQPWLLWLADRVFIRSGRSQRFKN